MSLVSKFCVLLLGACTHLLYFNRSEHHMRGTRYVQLLVLALVLCVTVSTFVYGHLVETAVFNALSLVTIYLYGLYTSLIIYRLFFSPLCHIPGPLGSRISSLYLSLHLTELKAHTTLLSLHDIHGDFVRIGPSDVSTIHPKAIQAVYGPQSRCTKADWYDLTLPMVSMQTTRNRQLHDQRRRIWSRAFGERAMRGYEQRIRHFQDQLLDKLASAVSQNTSFDVTELFTLYAFDVMGDLAFGEGFDMLKTNEFHWAVKLVGDAMAPMGLMLPTWMFRVLTAIPFAARGWWGFISYCCKRLELRMDDKTITSDILYTLLEPYNGVKPSTTEMNILQGDTQLIIVAGSDTTATTLACLFYELVQKPEHMDLLRKEIEPHFQFDGEIPHQQLQYLEHLNAVIYETLRLHPPVGTGLQRTTPPEGLEIGGMFVPGESIYEDAFSFLPERWYKSSTLVKEIGAFAPFSAGPYSCIGRPLALLNLRTTVAKLLNRFDVSFADGEDGKAFERDMKTRFTAAPGGLRLRFAERKIES